MLLLDWATSRDHSIENVTGKTHERNQPSFLYLVVLLWRQPALAPCSSIAAPDKALVRLLTVSSIFRNYRIILSPRDRIYVVAEA